jgi:methionyl-tRNA formyltransferase
MEQMRPDIGVVVAYGKILPREVLDLPPYGCINVHASLLPKYRGAAPIAWALLQGEVVTGVSVIRMVERLDAGDILMARTISIGEEEDALELGERLARVGAEALIDTLQGLEEGTLRPIPQREEEASYAPRLKKSDGELRWEQTAEMLHRRVRALVPWPGAFTFWEGKRLKVHRASVREGPSLGKPGQVVRASGGDLWVQTGDGYLALVEIQLEGRPSMRATVFLQGYPSIAGSMLG